MSSRLRAATAQLHNSPQGPRRRRAAAQDSRQTCAAMDEATHDEGQLGRMMNPVLTMWRSLQAMMAC